RVDGQLSIGGKATEQLGDPLVLRPGQAELGVRLRPARRGGSPRDRVLGRRPCRTTSVTDGYLCAARGEAAGHAVSPARLRGALRLAHAGAKARTALVKKPSPSSPGPVSRSIAGSGCGISPTTLPLSLQIRAMPEAEPFGLAPTYRASTCPRASSPDSVAESAT